MSARMITRVNQRVNIILLKKVTFVVKENIAFLKIDGTSKRVFNMLEYVIFNLSLYQECFNIVFEFFSIYKHPTLVNSLPP